MDAEAVGELSDLRRALVAAFFDDVGGTEFAGEVLPVDVTAHGDDRLRSHLLGGEDSHQSDSAVADDGDRLTGTLLGGICGEPPGAEHIGCGQQRRDEIVIRLPRRGDQGAVGMGNASEFGLGADPAVDEDSVDAAGLVAGGADRAGVVGDDE